PPLSEGGASPGATLSVPFLVPPREQRTIVLRLAWHVGATNLRIGKDPDSSSQPLPPGNYRAWYAGRFPDITAVTDYWRERYTQLRAASRRFSDCFYDTNLPPEVIEAIAANLTILKSPTVLRQADGRLWSWEGCSDNSGCCHGSCTHVWNYAQAIPHLFPNLERSLRETEFGVSQDGRGHQAFRTSLPIRPVVHDFHAAADGQLGGIMKVYREWRVSGDLEWLKRLWPKVKKSLDFCIEEWDPHHRGVLEEPHHNTYDIEFWGPDGMCASFYLGALQAAVIMGQALGDEPPLYRELLQRGLKKTETELYDGEYFLQKIQWEGLRAKSPLDVASFGGNYSPEAIALLNKEGPKYQYGAGCLADGVLGSWMALVCGIGQVLDRGKVRSHLQAVHRYNLKRDLTAHANPQRPSYACGAEGGLLICTWPKGGELSLPFVYSNEVWTGIEYQVASHLMLLGRVEEALDIVRACRSRYDGRVRNPFNEYECGHWYARAMSSYAMLQGLSGARYDAVDKVLYLTPSLKGDFQCFLSTATGYGTVGVRRGKPFLEVRSGTIDTRKIEYQPAPS
ncbi:MAG TPA: GH116 family glycosyl hydrolase, partial [Candidatus Paceibacterota bacterium]|nr:GH116 family glycosyl hydrolase [Candidatus Paceibacterota bacterium]